MKTLTFTLAALLSFVVFAQNVFAQNVTQPQAAKAFEQMLDKSSSNAKVGIASASASVANTTVVIGDISYQTAIKVWFQLEKDGKFVNPSLHRWDPNERFKVFVQTAVPAYFALYQNYPEDRPATRQVYPDKKYPQTFHAVPAGSVFEVPVSFKMDNDLRKEIIVLTFARVDEPLVGGTAIAVATATASNGTTVSATAVAQAETLRNRTDAAPVRIEGAAAAGVLMSAKNVNTAMDYLSSQAENSSKVSISAVASATVISADKDDVAVYVLGEGKTAQTQLTLNK